MTRDARLSALHRGDFRPGAALPSPAFPPDPYSDAPRSQVLMPGGRCPGPPEPAVTNRSRRTPLPAPPSGSSPETPLLERGCESSNINSLSSQYRNHYVVTTPCPPCVRPPGPDHSPSLSRRPRRRGPGFNYPAVTSTSSWPSSASAALAWSRSPSQAAITAVATQLPIRLPAARA